MDDRRMRAKSVNFERGQDPRHAMGIGRLRERTDRDLKTGDIVSVYSISEDREILVEMTDDKVYSGLSKVDGSYMDSKVKVLDPDYHSGILGKEDKHQMIRMYEDEDFWFMVE